MALIPNIFVKRPVGVEHDFAGTVVSQAPPEDPSSSTPTFTVGQKVWGAVEPPQGALSEYIAANPNYIVPIPDELTVDEAAGYAVVGLTGLMCLDFAKVEEGQKIFVLGGRLVRLLFLVLLLY